MPEANPADAAALDAGELLNMITGAWVSQITRAVARTAYSRPPRRNRRDRRGHRANREPWSATAFRLMREESSIGLLSYLGEHRFGLTGRGHLLCSDVGGSLRALAL